MTVKQEVQETLRQRVLNILDKRILPAVFEKIEKRTFDLTTADPEYKDGADEAYRLIYKGLVEESAEQLVEILDVWKDGLYEI